MESSLQFNMGNITLSFLFDSDNAIALSKEVNKNISAVLRYSSHHWTHHLPSCPCPIWLIPIISIVVFWSSSKLHLYISALARLSQDTILSQNWKNQFTHIPVFTHTKASIDLPLMISAQGRITAVMFSIKGTQIVSGSHNSVQVWSWRSWRATPAWSTWSCFWLMACKLCLAHMTTLCGCGMHQQVWSSRGWRVAPAWSTWSCFWATACRLCLACMTSLHRCGICQWLVMSTLLEICVGIFKVD